MTSSLLIGMTENIFSRFWVRHRYGCDFCQEICWTSQESFWSSQEKVHVYQVHA